MKTKGFNSDGLETDNYIVCKNNNLVYKPDQACLINNHTTRRQLIERIYRRV